MWLSGWVAMWLSGALPTPTPAHDRGGPVAWHRGVNMHFSVIICILRFWCILGGAPRSGAGVEVGMLRGVGIPYSKIKNMYFLVVGCLVSWFQGFSVFWFPSFLLSWFQRFNKSLMFSKDILSILPHFSFMFLIDIDLISKISNLLSHGSSGLFGARLFPNRQAYWFQNFWDL